jgi:threonine synthase
MTLYSLHNPAHHATFEEAVRRGLAPDGGLYMPAEIPKLGGREIDGLRGMSPDGVAKVIGRKLFGDAIPGNDLDAIITRAIDFPLPLVQLDDDTFILELFHGPTLAFKDVGARFLASVLSRFSGAREGGLTVLVATSGDTGSAVAHGFFGVEGVDVVLLYPSGKVSPTQELQFATLGGNITALEIRGTFDDCQALVKAALSDPELNASVCLTSANSINIARLLPQTFYYFSAYAALSPNSGPPVFSVPAGNLGNLTAGVMARSIGLPVRRFIAASNSNDVLQEYLRTGQFRPRPAVRTTSNAMDVGNPSNFPRLAALFGGERAAMAESVHASAWTDDATMAAIEEVYSRHGYVLDPHSAVAYRAWSEYRKTTSKGQTCVVLATAHPAKFPEVYDDKIRSAINIPEQISSHFGKKKLSILMDASVDRFKVFLRDRRKAG